jgi:hypothetical protein
MTANAADYGSAALSAFLRAAGVVALAVGAALALVFAFAAAVVIGLMVAGAALAMRLWPWRRQGHAPARPGVLEARRTPDGWVVETFVRRGP